MGTMPCSRAGGVQTAEDAWKATALQGFAGSPPTEPPLSASPQWSREGKSVGDGDVAGWSFRRWVSEVCCRAAFFFFSLQTEREVFG